MCALFNKYTYFLLLVFIKNNYEYLNPGKKLFYLKLQLQWPTELILPTGWYYLKWELQWPTDYIQRSSTRILRQVRNFSRQKFGNFSDRRSISNGPVPEYLDRSEIFCDKNSETSVTDGVYPTVQYQNT